MLHFKINLRQLLTPRPTRSVVSVVPISCKKRKMRKNGFLLHNYSSCGQGLIYKIYAHTKLVNKPIKAIRDFQQPKTFQK